jgi:hypothetical protein
LSLPPAAGSGVEVAGMDPRSVPGTTVYDNGTTLTPTVRLTGTYDGHRLTLTEPPVPAPAPNHPEPATETPGTACANPGDGHYTHEQRETAIAYAQAQPDLGTLWYSEAMRVLNISFTTNLDQHRQALQAIYPGPLCLVRARIAKNRTGRHPAPPPYRPRLPPTTPNPTTRLRPHRGEPAHPGRRRHTRTNTTAPGSLRPNRTSDQLAPTHTTRLTRHRHPTDRTRTPGRGILTPSARSTDQPPSNRWPQPHSLSAAIQRDDVGPGFRR